MKQPNKQKSDANDKHKDIASALREARDSLGVSLKTAAKETRINTEKLQHFEAGRFNIDETYTIGQLTSYARYLGLDPIALLKLDTQQLKPNVEMNRRYRRARAFVASNSISASALIGVVLFALGAAIWLVVSYFAAPKLIIFSPETDGVVEQYSIIVSGETSSGSEIFINGEPVLVDLEGGFEHRVLLAEGLNEIEVKAVNSLSREALQERILIADFPDVEQD